MFQKLKAKKTAVVASVAGAFSTLSGTASAALDPTEVTTAISGSSSIIDTIGSAVLVVIAGILVFKLVKRVM